MISEQTIDLLHFYHDKYNRPNFIENDPIQIPHLFSQKQDIEIAGLFAATLAWGNRTSIINSCKKLIALMDNQPYQFILHHQAKDLKPFSSFVHRTFNTTDVLYFIAFLKSYYSKNTSLENLFLNKNIEQGLMHFHNTFFSLEDAPHRTKKHISTPQKKSTCKRLNMYLRWMVRKDKHGVDFGIWKKIKPADLMMPIDVHVENYARKLILIERKQRDWLTVCELTRNLKSIDTKDPVRFDFALFGMGIEKVIL
ncbi:MAG: TIGR02757 family protein [Chitinophagales bacterium]|nr:TIGR02757 family protein [Bacteroidota bacterium]